MSPEELFLSELEQIQRIAAFVCRKNGVYGPEAEDFESEVQTRMIEDDYGILRKFEGKSQLSTYLTVVIQRLFLDYRIAKWGRWRPAARARRLGDEAVRLDALINRDRLGVEEAIQIMHTNHASSRSLSELRDLAGELRRAPRPTATGQDDLAEIPADDSSDRGARRQDLEGVLLDTEKALTAALEAVSPEDRLILRMRFQQGIQVAEIARLLHLEARPLYPRIQRCLRRLRSELEASGVEPGALFEALDWEGADLRVFSQDEEKRGPASVQSG